MSVYTVSIQVIVHVGSLNTIGIATMTDKRSWVHSISQNSLSFRNIRIYIIWNITRGGRGGGRAVYVKVVTIAN